MTTYDDGPYSQLWEPLNKAAKEANQVRALEVRMRVACDARDCAIYMCLAQGATHASVAERTGMDRETVVQLACEWAKTNGIPWPPVLPPWPSRTAQEVAT
jgi:hypothetical protein